MPFAFVNPLMLIGLLGAALPVLVHLLGRRRARERYFPAIDFLLASERRLAARRRVRHLLLLLARMALVAAIAMALARPLLPGAVVAGSGQPVSAVVVFDVTASMSAGVGDRTAFEHARTVAVEALASLPAGSEAAVLTAERRPRRVTAGFVPIADAILALSRLRPGFSSGGIAAAVAEAARSLESARRPLRTVIIASDLQSSTWKMEDGTPLVLNGDIRVLDAGVATDDDVVLERVVDVVDPEARTIAVEVSTAPTAAINEVSVQLFAGGELLNRGVARFSGSHGARAQLTVPAAVPPGASLTVELGQGGARPHNDRAFHWLQASPLTTILIADGAPHTTPWRDEIYYLERALLTEEGTLRVRVVDGSHGVLPGLAGVNVVVLANLATLDRPSVESLESFVNDGGGLLVTAGDRSSPSELTAVLGRLLPAVPRSIVSWAAGEPPIQLAARAIERQPWLLPFDSARAAETLASARLRHVLAVEPKEGARVLLEFSNHLPALVEFHHGRGRVALLTVTVDRDWGDLAVKPAFVPLMTRLVAMLANRLAGERRHDYVVGDEVQLTPDQGAKSLRVGGPDGRALATTAAGDAWVLAEAPELPGNYRVFVDDRPEPALDFVVNVDPAENDFSRYEAAQTGAPDAVSGAITREEESALPALIVAVLAFLSETLLARRAGEDSAP